MSEPVQPEQSTKSAVAERRKPEPLKPWNVVLVDDDDHSYDYVIRMVQELFGHSSEQAYEIARTVDTQGRAVLCTTHKERAEFKRDQVTAYGKDALIASCAGSMSAIVEPAP